ncbi:Asp23/Gls24 family envelope stress response protein, partial [Dysosmobacter welbionis]
SKPVPSRYAATSTTPSTAASTRKKIPKRRSRPPFRGASSSSPSLSFQMSFVVSAIEPFILIPKSCQVQSPRRHRGTGGGAVPPLQNAGDVLRGELALRRVQHGAGDGPYHVIQKAVGADLQFQQIS